MIVSSRACDASQWRFGDLAIWASRGRESAGVCVLWAFGGMHAAHPSYVCSLLSVRLGPQCCFTAQHAATALPTAAPVR